MSSTLLTEDTGLKFADLQAEQLSRYRAAFAAAGHQHTPRVSVSRSIFPIVTQQDDAMFGGMRQQNDGGVGMIDGFRATFGKTYVGSPDELIAELKNDAAVMSADTLMLAIPSQLGPELNLGILQNFAEHVAPALGWEPNTEGSVTGYPIQ